jgi:hypothetical protein
MASGGKESTLSNRAFFWQIPLFNLKVCFDKLRQEIITLFRDTILIGEERFSLPFGLLNIQGSDIQWKTYLSGVGTSLRAEGNHF